MNDEVLHSLVDRLRCGDAQAAEELLRQYEPILRVIVRRQLSAPLRRKFDSVDIVQSVWADVFDGFRQDRWEFSDAAHLRAFLVRTARNRLINRSRQQKTEVCQPDYQWEEQRDDALGSPSEEFEADELWNRMMSLCPAQHQDILRLRRQGYSIDEIAQRSGLHPGSVRRIFYNLARRLAVRS